MLITFSLVANVVAPIGTIMAERLLYLPVDGDFVNESMGSGTAAAERSRLHHDLVVLYGPYLGAQYRLARQ